MGYIKYISTKQIAVILRNIESGLIRSEYKLRIYDRYVLPAIRFKLTVHELTATNLAIAMNLQPQT